jgi:hypothetical protein
MVRARQVAAATGILAYISGFVGTFASGTNEPAATDSVESVQIYITRFGHGIFVSHTFSGLDTALVLCFAVFLCSVLRQAEGESGIFTTIAMAGAAVAVAADLVVLALHSATFVPAANTVDLRVLATAVLRELTILELFPWAAFFAGVAVVSLARRVLPGWLGWIAAVLAVFDLAVAIWSGLTGVNASVNLQSFVPPFVMIYLLLPFWMVAASVVLLRRELTRSTSAGKVSPATSV